MFWRPTWWLPALVACALMLAGPVLAEPSPEEKETARQLMDSGKKRLADGDLPGALAAFRSADQIMGVPTTALALGRVEAQMGMLTQATDTLRRAARFPRRPDEPDAFTAARAEAAALDRDVAQRIPAVIVEVEGPHKRDVKLIIDGRLVAGTPGVPIRLNPGSHRVEARARGWLSSNGEIDLAERQRRSLKLVLGRDPKAPEPAPHQAASPDFVVPPVSIALFSVAGVSLVIGAVTGGLAVARVADLEQACPNKACGEDQRDEHDEMLALSNTANATLAIAAVAAGAGLITLFVLQPDDTDSTRVGLSPSGLTLHRSF
jgi:hypothetical protein